MNKRFFIITISAVALLAAPASSLFAVTKNYEIGSGSSIAAFTGPEPPFALVVQTSFDPNLAGTAFSLNDGQSFTFNFFNIWTDETFVNADDKVPQSIQATLDFSIPSADPTISGSTVGTSTFFGILQYGQVTWNGPATVTLPGDRTFQVSLSDEHFNFGIFGLFNGEGYGATVEATVTQLTSVQSAPESGNTALLLGAAIGGLVLMTRTRVAKSASLAPVDRRRRP